MIVVVYLCDYLMCYLMSAKEEEEEEEEVCVCVWLLQNKVEV